MLLHRAVIKRFLIPDEHTASILRMNQVVNIALSDTMEENVSVIHEGLRKFGQSQLQKAGASWSWEFQEDRQCAYNVTFRRVRVTTAAVEKQQVLHIMSVCL